MSRRRGIRAEVREHRSRGAFGKRGSRTSKSFPRWFRPSAGLVAILATSSLIVLILNRPNSRQAVVSISCDAIRLPQPIVFSLEELRQLHVRSYGADMTRIRDLILSHDSTTERYSRVTSLGIQSRQSLSAGSLLVEPHPAFGDFTCAIPANNEIRAQAPRSGKQLALQVVSEGAEPALFDLQADVLMIREANRVKLTGLQLRKGSDIPYFSLIATNRRGLVRLRLSPEPSNGKGKPSATAFFQPGSFDITLIRQVLTLTPNRQIMLYGCKSPRLKLDGQDPTLLTKDVSSDLVVTPKQFTVNTLSLRTDQASGKHGVIVIEGRGVVDSVRQDGRELVPTALQDILNKSPSEKGLYALFAAFLVLAGTTFMNRCLAILAAIAFPDEN